MELPVIYEDADVVAINKPAGLMTHADGRSTDPTAEDWFVEKYGEKGGYVHRLDRDTSGVLLFAKNNDTYEFLRKAFHDREVQKTYLAIALGAPKETKGVIDFDIGRSRKDFRMRSAQPKAKGRLREALTHYEVLDTVKEGNQTFGLMRLEPKTGRTHQLRVHLKAIHHPIVGDPLYASASAPTFGLSRLALHAYELSVPKKGAEALGIVAPLPGDLAKAVSRFENASESFAS